MNKLVIVIAILAVAALALALWQGALRTAARSVPIESPQTRVIPVQNPWPTVSFHPIGA